MLYEVIHVASLKLGIGGILATPRLTAVKTHCLLISSS